MTRLLYPSLKKEFLLVSRDLHALLVLFVMPIAFILIMSLALQEQFKGESTLTIKGQLRDNSNSGFAQQIVAYLESTPFVSLNSNATTPLFTLEFTPNLEQAIVGEFNGNPAIRVFYAAELGKRERALIKAAVQEAFAYINVNQTAEELGYDEEYAKTQLLKEGAVITQDQLSNSHENSTPTSTQQNVPAWLVFAMFFVAIPISTTMIGERQQRTLTRLRTMAMSPAIWYFAKLLPYFIINICQMCLMLAVGVFIIPALGGEQLQLNVDFFALTLITVAVSISALGFAALVATLAKTTEQATILSGTGNILFGAIGGIMVPSFVMPEFMRWITLLSPMGWGLQGFLDVLVRRGTMQNIFTEVIVLTTFGVSLMFISILLFKYQKESGR